MRESNVVEIIKAACMACAIPVLLYLAFAISVYGDTVDANGNNLGAAPVLAKPESSTRSTDRNRSSQRQVRESTNSAERERAVALNTDSRGGIQNLSPAELYARLIDERYIPWTEPAILKGNSFADRLRE